MNRITQRAQARPIAAATVELLTFLAVYLPVSFGLALGEHSAPPHAY